MTMTASHSRPRGYTLIELVVAVGIYALVMSLAAGAYLIVIGVSKQAQGTVTGINDLSFALDSMARAIRTGTDYNCAGTGDCASGASSFSFTDQSENSVSYALSGTSIQKTVNGVSSTLTDPSVSISNLRFYTSGTRRPPTNYTQPHVKILISGSVSVGRDRTVPFWLETSATMRGTDL